MKRVANARETVVPIPPVVVPVHVHVALAIVAIENHVAFYKISPMPPLLEYSRS